MSFTLSLEGRSILIVRVLVVEDNVELLQKFSEAIQSDPQLQLIGAVGTGKDGLDRLLTGSPDVVLVDLGLPDISGIEIIKCAFELQKNIDVLVVTMFSDDMHIISSLEAGATGYLLKDALTEKICHRIHEVRNGGSPISPSIARRVLSKFRPLLDAAVTLPQISLQTMETHLPPSSEVDLTEREVELLRLIAKGLSFNEVGETLQISPHTVVTHVKRIYRKLSVHSRGEAVFEATQLGLV